MDSSSDAVGACASDIATTAVMDVVPPVVQLLAGNSVTGATVLACLNAADTRGLRRLHPAVAEVVAAVPWADMGTPVVDVVRWRAALPAAVGVRVGHLSERPDELAAAAAALAGVIHLDLRERVSEAVLVLLPPALRVLKVRALNYLRPVFGASVARLTALVSLDCDNWEVQMDSLPPSLRDLRLTFCRIPSTADFRHLSALRVLSCTATELSSAIVSSFPPSLEELFVGGTHLPAGVSLAHLPLLRVLRARFYEGITAVTVASLPPCLLELVLPGLRAAPSFAHLHALQKLDIRDSDCGDALLASLPPTLVTLDVSLSKKLTPAAVLPHLPVLTTLSVSCTEIGDALVASLPAGLTTLGIVDCRRVTHGATLDHLPALRELRNVGTDLSPTAIAACRGRGCVAPADGVLRGYAGNVSCLAVLPDGRLVSGDRGGALQVWDVRRLGKACVVWGVGSEAWVLAVGSGSSRPAGKRGGGLQCATVGRGCCRLRGRVGGAHSQGNCTGHVA